MTLPLPPVPCDLERHLIDLSAAYPWLNELKGTAQNAKYHGEGDVWIHTQLVLRALFESRGWAVLPPPEQRIVYWAALLHDVAKPHCTRLESGQLVTKGHARRGALMARQVLWRMRADFHEREQIVHLVGAHQVPFWALERPDPRAIPIRLSQRLRCDLLALLAEADARGRICDDTGRLLDNIELFRELCRENDCYARPFEFSSAHARFEYTRRADRSPDYAAFDDTEFEVTILSGLPGAGKDTWISSNAAGIPVVSLDQLREELDVEPAEPQGKVVDAARTRARELLRARSPFVWNATNLSRQLRKPLIDLCADYHARIRLVYCEVPFDTIVERNRARTAAVPLEVIERLLWRWEVPTVDECHERLLAVQT